MRRIVSKTIKPERGNGEVQKERREAGTVGYIKLR